MICSVQAEPEDIRAGDILMFINEEFVLDKEKSGPQALPPGSACVSYCLPTISQEDHPTNLEK